MSSKDYRGNEEDHQMLTMSGSDGQRYHYILESLYRLIHHLVDTGRNFAVIIRTYGLDAPHALASLAHGIQGNHPGFPHALRVPVNKGTGSVRREGPDGIVLEAMRSGGSSELLTKLTHERDVYRFLSQSEVGSEC